MNVAAPDRETAVLEASLWFIRRRAKRMDAQEVQVFEDWLKESPQNEDAYQSVARSWGLMGSIEDDDAFVEVRDHDAFTLQKEARRKVLTIAAAVSCIAILGVGGWGVTQSNWLTATGWFAPPVTQEFRTTIGQRATTTLADGSVVTLDTDSLIRVRLSGHARHIDLEQGRAFFQVAKDKSRPFVVAAAGRTVRATGTAFDVRSEQGRFEVTLLEGRVQVREAETQKKDAQAADLRQGWRLSVGEDARWRMEPVDLARATAWHDGMLSFREEALVDAVAEMNRYSRRKITFRGAPPDTFVLGRFPAGDVDAFARGLELNKLARIVAQSDEEIVVAAR